MRQSWTDDRLDDLSHRMDERFNKVDERFDKVEGELKSQGKELRAEIKGQGEELRKEIKGLGKELRNEMAGMEARLRAQASEHYLRTGEELGKLSAEMKALQRTIIRIGWTGAITLLAAVAGVLISQLF